eukprot:c10413_g1_i2.p1 GENE.c10413_g1_i2~~c10413_g1_i2.p1  ORF type:complete len:148 (+),score=26.02 c10413_g1_i2:41-484(+)
MSLLGLLNKHVRVTVGDDSHAGYVFTVDPVTNSVVLVMIELDPLSLTEARVINGDRVTSIEELPTDPRVQEFLSGTITFTTQAKGITQQEVSDRLSRYHIPYTVSEAGQFTVMDCVTIDPPYLPQSCTGTNRTVLRRVCELLDSRPD